jgi:hypothetical protein
MVDLKLYRAHRRWGATACNALRSARLGRSAPTPRDSHGHRSDRGWYFDHPDRVPGRWVGHADRIERTIGHEGWYSNSFEDETYRGVVYRLPHGRGYFVGYVDSCNDNIYIEYTVEDSDSAAAHLADDIARCAAERAREYEAHWQDGCAQREALDSALQELRQAVRGVVWVALEPAGAAATDDTADQLEDAREQFVAACRAIEPPCRNTALRDSYSDGFGGPVRLPRLGRPAFVVGA